MGGGGKRRGGKGEGEEEGEASMRGGENAGGNGTSPPRPYKYSVIRMFYELVNKHVTFSEEKPVNNMRRTVLIITLIITLKSC